MTSLAAYARSSHQVITPRIILRSARSCDAKPFVIMINDPLDSPYGREKGPDQTVEQQLELIEQCLITTAQGKNARMTIILKNEYDTDSPTAAFEVDDGIVIGTTGFNSFKTEPSLSDPSKSAITGDIGAVIDHRYRRKGYAMEVLSALVEYGFNELGCGQISLSTDQTNLPWRALMKTMGLDKVEVLKRIVHSQAKGESGKMVDEAIYRFDRTIWDDTKKNLVACGKWYL